MKFKQLIGIVTLVLTAQVAWAEFTTVALASEVRLSDFRLPASVNGVASFKACSACDMTTASVNAGTRYQLDGKLVSLPELRKSLATVSNRDQKTVLIMHHLKSDLITQIYVRL